MSKAYIFLGKMVVLGLTLLAFLLACRLSILIIISLPVLFVSFGFVISKIIDDSPKELFNFKRSETYFSKGGLRDLLRIPVVFFAFVHDVAVWGIWGVYQIFILFVDIVIYLKEFLVWVLNLIIWFVLQLLPFWRILLKMTFFYLIKWPWWIYRYAFYSIKSTFNWNILKISFIGTFIGLLAFQIFYFIDIYLEVQGMRYIGIALALLPISWLFGEISALRAQNLLFAPFKSVMKKFRNGLETVRAMLFFTTFFVVLVLAEAGLDLLGWLPKSGMILLGLTFNFGFLINLVLLALVLILVFGSFIIPTHRLYNEFNETSIKDVLKLLKHIINRGLQYLSGFIPSSFFAFLSSIPALLVVVLAIFINVWIKNTIIEAKINKIETSATQTNSYKNQKEINYLQYIKSFPKQILQEMGHRVLLEDELNTYQTRKESLSLDLIKYNSEAKAVLTSIENRISDESKKEVVNQTRIEELEALSKLHQKRLSKMQFTIGLKTAETELDIEYAQRKLKHLPIIFFLSGFFLVIVTTFALTFFFAYFGNFFYKAYLFRNDDTDAEWKSFIVEEKKIDKRQPLLSATLNLILIATSIAVVIQTLRHNNNLIGDFWSFFQ